MHLISDIIYFKQYRSQYYYYYSYSRAECIPARSDRLFDKCQISRFSAPIINSWIVSSPVQYQSFLG